MNWFKNSIELKVVGVITLAFLVVGSLSSLYIFKAGDKYHDDIFLNEARIIFKLVQNFRAWNVMHGGVYVFLKPGEKTNPYLYEVRPEAGKKADMEAEITTSNGRILTLKNPALMTREIADLVSASENFKFKLTSLKLINPVNAPDAFEREAMQGMKLASDEKYGFEQINGETYFRYVAPLVIKDACLKCHGFQGFKVGDIHGAVSVSFPADTKQHDLLVIYAGLVMYIAITLLVIFILRLFVTKPIIRLAAFSEKLGLDEADYSSLVKGEDEVGQLTRTLMAANQRINDQQHELKELAVTLDEQSRRDSLTTLHNRRHLMLESGQWFARAKRAKSSISVLMLDIDHFKEINDRHGHIVGDKVLQHFSEFLKEMVREYDMLVRFGGEEFLVLLPDTGREEAVALAERIRKEIEAAPVTIGLLNIKFTVSIGVYTDTDCNLETAISKSDKALYKAKEGGRNRVCEQD